MVPTSPTRAETMPSMRRPAIVTLTCASESPTGPNAASVTSTVTWPSPSVRWSVASTSSDTRPLTSLVRPAKRAMRARSIAWLWVRKVTVPGTACAVTCSGAPKPRSSASSMRCSRAVTVIRSASSLALSPACSAVTCRSCIVALAPRMPTVAWA